MLLLLLTLMMLLRHSVTYDEFHTKNYYCTAVCCSTGQKTSHCCINHMYIQVLLASVTRCCIMRNDAGKSTSVRVKKGIYTVMCNGFWCAEGGDIIMRRNIMRKQHTSISCRTQRSNRASQQTFYADS